MRTRYLTAMLDGVFGALAIFVGCTSNSGSRTAASDTSSVDASVVDSSVVDGNPGAPDADAGDAGSHVELPIVKIQRQGGSPVSPLAFGNNYWNWPNWTDAGTTGVTGTESFVRALHLNVIRAGGDTNDNNSPEPFDAAHIDAFIQYCRAVGAEPIIQVPLVADLVNAGAPTPQRAADIVSYVNVTKGYGVKYWEIGNEPDVYPVVLGATFPIQTANDYCEAFKAYAVAMKTANTGSDVAIEFLGPELLFQYLPGDGGITVPELGNRYIPRSDWLSQFLDGCKDYVDVVTIHYYPFLPSTASAQNALSNVEAFHTTIATVRTSVAQHGRAGTPLGITESNTSFEWDLSKYTGAGAEAAPNTFFGALWTADIAGAALEANLWTTAFFAIGEIAATAPYTAFGYVIGGTTPTPEYYAQQLLSANFRGATLIPSGVPSGFSVYANYDATQACTSVLVINKNSLAMPLSIAIDAAPPLTHVYAPTSMALLTIPDALDAPTHLLVYTPDLADTGPVPAPL